MVYVAKNKKGEILKEYGVPIVAILADEQVSNMPDSTLPRNC